MNVYLNFDGNCQEAFEFYRSVFGGEFVVLQRFADAPAEAGMPTDANDLVMHVSLPVGEATLMGCDVLERGSLVVGNNFSISLAPVSRAACDALFGAISEGGEVTMALEETFWGSYFGSARDRFGVNWMLNFDLESDGGSDQ